MLTAGSILLVSILGSYRSVETLAATLAANTAERARGELRLFFDPVVTNLKIAARWGATGEIDPTDVAGLNRRFIPLLDQIPQVSSLLVARDDGVEYLLLKDTVSGTWRNRETRVLTWGKRTRWRTWSDVDAPVGEEWRELDYDPRLRRWFEGAMWNEAGEIFWTRPYTFFTTGDPGLTASLRWRIADDSAHAFVIAFDVLLTDISRFTSGLKISDHGMVVVITDDEQVVGLPRSERYRTEAQLRAGVLQPLQALGINALTDAAAAWNDAGRGSGGAFRFESGGEAWWTAALDIVPDSGSRFRIVTVVPESDFLGEVERQRNIILLITLAALLVAVAMSLYLARSYGRPLEALSRQSSRIRQLDLRQGEPIQSGLREVRELADAQQQMLNALQSFARYVPVDVVKELMRRGEMAQIGGRSAELTVLFTDIRDFTTVAESMTPEALTAHMADYFETLIGVLEAERGTVDKLVGDAVVAFWGAPNPDARHARNAVRAVLRARTRIAELNRRWQQQGLPVLPTRYGLHCGPLVVGNIGAPSRLSYTVLGDTVNLASRLEGLNKIYGTEILASGAVQTATGSEFEWRLVDWVAVKGRTEPVEIHEPLGFRGEVAPATLLWARGYEEALRAFRDRKYGAARARLGELDTPPAGDLSAARLLQRCEELLRSPPADDWDGVSRFDSK